MLVKNLLVTYKGNIRIGLANTVYYTLCKDKTYLQKPSAIEKKSIVVDLPA